MITFKFNSQPPKALAKCVYRLKQKNTFLGINRRTADPRLDPRCTKTMWIVWTEKSDAVDARNFLRGPPRLHYTWELDERNVLMPATLASSLAPIDVDQERLLDVEKSAILFEFDLYIVYGMYKENDGGLVLEGYERTYQASHHAAYTVKRLDGLLYE